MVKCSKHVIPPAIQVNLTDQPAHDLGVGLTVQPRRVLSDRRLRTSLPNKKPINPH